MKPEDPNEEFDALMARNLDSDVPLEVEARLRGRLAAFREKLESPQGETSSPKETTIVSIFRKTGFARVRWATATAIAAVAVASVIVFNPWGGGPGDLYAVVVAQLHNARSLTFTISGDENAETERGWEMAYKEPGRLRYSFPTGDYTIMDFKQRKAIFVKAARRTYRYWNMSNFSGEKEYSFFDRIRSLPERAQEVLPKRQMDGRTVQGFRVNRFEEEEEEGMVNVVVWIDVKTKNPVRIEGELRGKSAGRTIHVRMSNFDFTADLDDALFDLTPPAGFSERPSISTIDRDEIHSVEVGS